MTDNWTIREATTADTEAIVALRNEVFGSHISPAEWDWRHFGNRAGRNELFVAEDAGRIIGHGGRAQTRINVNGEPVPMVHAGDAFVHSDYQRLGVVTAMRAAMRATPLANCVKLGLATPAGQTVGMRIGYYHLGNMVRLWMILNPRAIVEKRTGSPLLAALSEPPLRLLLHLWAGRKRRPGEVGDITIEPIDSFDSSFDELWSSIKDDLPLGPWQDAEYLNWRYRACPVAQYTVLAAHRQESLLGFIVLTWGDEREERYGLGKIVGLLFAPREMDAALTLISAAADYFEDRGADAITCDMFGRGPFYRSLRSCGFFRQGRGLAFIIRLGTPDMHRSLLLDRDNWYFMETLT